jgi:aspartyl-tRNA(Asn)/glutamyl-tRNA(Gln) amidotransferase subunit C
MALTIEQVRWVAELARLALSKEELEALREQLSAVLAYVDQLQDVDTTNVEPLAHPLAIQNVFREDSPADCLSPDDALANAPRRQGDFYSVPAVLE